MVNSPLTHNSEVISKGTERFTETVEHIMNKKAIIPLARPEERIQKVQHQQVGGDNFVPDTNQRVFNMGTMEASSSGISGRSRNSQQRTSSWSRKRRNISEGQKAQQKPGNEDGDNSTKRKANDRMEVSSKLSKNDAGLMVHQKPSSTDI
ncbi:unnamed protein product [Arabis nemorensis]|uniref:Uncharacterized protein n=1 Tax=Arabis nemorensis TaxID=586526 RepID=A0A565CU24_9BRAS|nr:unnamed protein product [Arabis nemorensis]